MTIGSRPLFQAFKYAVYAALTINIYLFWAEESLAATVQFVNGVPLLNLIDAYSATIDTAAWVLLLLMFELDTYVLEDHHHSPVVRRSLYGLRIVSYGFIIYSFYGYLVNLGFHYQVVPIVGVTDLCTLVTDGWSFAIDLDEYSRLTLENCGVISDAATFQRFENISAVVDDTHLTDIRYLAWVDVINAAVWLLIVGILEIDVWLQERNRLGGPVHRLSNAFKWVLYTTLLLAASYWTVKGDFVDSWDAWLWLVAFVFIEHNVIEWRQEIKESLQQNSIASVS